MTTDRIASIKDDVEEAERQWKAGSKQYRTSVKGIRAACIVADIQFLLAALAEKDARIKELEAANYQMAMDRAAAERKVIILTEGYEWGFCKECERIKELEKLSIIDHNTIHTQRQCIKELTEALEAVQELIDNSRGVFGLHLNGDLSPWDELLEGGRFQEWLLPFSQVGAKAAREVKNG
jgi:flagellar biosynthesis/type III secretory pathway protein FliH